MNTLLLFFALPVATILLAIVLEKILRSPTLVAIAFFAIYLIITFTAFDSTFLVFAIIYTILAFIAAFIAEIFFRKYRDIEHSINNTVNLGITDNDNNNSNNNINNNNNNNCNCRNNVVTANLFNNTTGNRSTWCCHRRS